MSRAEILKKLNARLKRCRGYRDFPYNHERDGERAALQYAIRLVRSIDRKRV
jgi:hypothetical protein